MASSHVKEEPIPPKTRPPIADRPAAPKAPAHAVAKEWYSPREADFRPEYARYAANQAKESWKEYWYWVQTFYAGAIFTPGWTAQATATLQGVQSEKMRDELRADLNELGRRVAAEWSKDNGARKIDTTSLRVFGGRISKACAARRRFRPGDPERDRSDPCRGEGQARRLSATERLRFDPPAAMRRGTGNGDLRSGSVAWSGDHAATILHQFARASTQPNSATQVAANNRGTAKASGREIDSPSLRPGAANAATVRAYSGTTCLIRSFT